MIWPFLEGVTPAGGWRTDCREWPGQRQSGYGGDGTKVILSTKRRKSRWSCYLGVGGKKKRGDKNSSKVFDQYN